MSGLGPRRRGVPAPLPAALPDLRTRVLLSAALFATGLAIWCVAPAGGWLGLVLVLAGHLPLWVRHQSNAPGGATPDHEEVWAPVEDDWLDAGRGARGDAASAGTPRPGSSPTSGGCLTLLGVLFLLGVVLVVGRSASSGPTPSSAWRSPRPSSSSRSG